MKGKTQHGTAVVSGTRLVKSEDPAPGWKVVQVVADGAAYEHDNGLVVICSEAKELDGKCWLHVSLSRANILPSYSDLKHVKAVFVGHNRKAIMILPAQTEHVNIHHFCLHLFCCLDEDPLPDFTCGTGSL